MNTPDVKRHLEPSPSPFDDEEFRRRICRRDTAAWTAVIEEYGPRLERIAKMLLNPAMDPENAALEAFARAVRRCSSYDPRRRLLPWLSRICVNVCLDQRRRAHREGEALRGLARGVVASSRPSEHHADGIQLVRACVARLPARTREVVLLRYACGIGTREIARLHRTSQKTVQWHVRHAHETLRTMLTEGNEE